MTYQRLPGPGRKRFAYDGDAHRITRVEAYPALGRSSIVFFDDPLRPWMEQWRVCSTICSITPLPASESTRGVPNDGDECGPSGEE
jgi:hypothetical protein